MAAGFGTRLRPSTEVCPKPLIPVAGVEPLFFAIEKLRVLGIKNVVVNSHYLPEKIQAAINDWAPLFKGMEIRVSFESPKILGTGGGLLKIMQDHPDLFKTQGLLLQNGDTVASFDLQQLFQNPNQSTFALSLTKEHLKKYKPLWVDGDSHYTGIGATPPTPDSRPAHFLGVHYLCNRDLKKLAAKNLAVIECDLFNGIYKPLGLDDVHFEGIEYFAENSNDFWFDMTNTEFLLEAQRFILDSMKRMELWPKILRARYPGIRETEPGIWILSKNLAPQTSSVIRRYYSPAVLVESEASQSDRELGGFSLGPHASLIHTKGQLLSKADQQAIEIRDAVVLVSSEKQSTFPSKIEGEIRVV